MQSEVKVFNSVDEVLEYSSQVEKKSVVYVDEDNILKKYLIKRKSKNLIKYNTNFPYTIRGITITQGEDGWLVANGTATGSGNISVATLPAFTQEYIDKYFDAKKMIVCIEREYEPGKQNTGKFENFAIGRNAATGYIKEDGSLREQMVIDLKKTTYDFLKNYVLTFGQAMGVYTNYKFRLHIQLVNQGEESQFAEPDLENVDNIVVYETESHYIIREFETDVINIIEIGGKSVEMSGSNNYDNKVAFDKYIELIKQYPNKGYKLYIPSGVFLTSPVHIDCNNFCIVGSDENVFGRTYLSALYDQDYIIKIGGTAEVFGQDEKGNCMDRIQDLRVCE